MIKKITEDEIQFMEMWHLPRCLVESLFSDFDNLTEFDENKFGDLRLYQIPMLSDEPSINFEATGKYHKLDRKQEFKLRKNVSDIYNFGARKTGKTLVTEKLDIPISMLHADKAWCGFASIDSIHLEVLDVIKDAIDCHPILSIWKKRLKGEPKYKFTAKNGWKLEGVNMNLKSKSPGNYFYGKHFNYLWVEEMSFETEEVAKKRKEALSEVGGVLRFSGMTNFTAHSPVGKIYYKAKNKKQILNIPQYINPMWDEKEKVDRIEEYGGEKSPNFRVFVLGEVLEDGVSEFDMERVNECYQEKKKIKRFEIKKDQYNRFRDIIVVERPNNAERIFICGDIGDGKGGSDIIILSEINDKYQYLYNITLYSLKYEEQLEILTYLIEQTQANVIALDNGEGIGRTLSDKFEIKYGKKHVVRYAGNTKVKMGFEVDEKGVAQYEKGKPIYKYEFMSEWSVSRLKKLLYSTRILIPMDYKFDNQINSVIGIKSGTRAKYPCPAETGDHLFDAFRVFAIAQWLKKDFNQTKKMTQEWGTGVTEII